MAGTEQRAPNDVLGVQFADSTIRVVEVRRQGGDFVVTAAGSADLRTGYIDPSSPIPVATIAAKLRELLKSIGATSRTAVFGVPVSHSAVRTFSFPNMPDDEMRVVIDGEVRHQRLLTESGGAVDYMVVGRHVGEGDVSVLTMAADDVVLWRLGDIAKQAGLRVIANAPVHSAMLRGMLSGRTVQRPVLCLTITRSNTELAVVTGAGIQLYRRLDVRGSDITGGALAFEDLEEAENRAEGLVESDVPAAFRKTKDADGFDAVIVQRLMTEIRRSLEYLNRTQPDDAAIESVLLGVTDERLAGLQRLLSDALGVRCEAASVRIAATGAASTVLGALPDAGPYLPAIGLALQPYADRDALPKFNLTPSPRTLDRAKGPSSGIRPALIASGVFAVIALGAWLTYFFQGNSLAAQNDELQREYEKLEAEYLPQQEELRNEVAAITELANEGIPFGPILDSISMSLDPGVGLTSATFNLGGSITVEGQAETEMALVSTLNQLRNIGGFVSTFVNSFENRDGRGLTFSISSQYDLTHPAAEHLERANEIIPPSAPEGS